MSMSDHLPLFLLTHWVKLFSKCNSHKRLRYRCFKHFYLNIFYLDLSTSKLENVETGSTPDRSLKHVYEIVNGTLNKHALIQETRVKSYTQSHWLDIDVREAIH